jgi:hypothetical protein
MKKLLKSVNKKIKVMNKTEVRRLKVSRALKALVINHNAFNIQDADGGRMDFCVEGTFGHTYQCQFTRNGFDVACFDAIGLAGSGWSADDIRIQQTASSLEFLMNATVQEELKKVEAEVA